MIESIEPFGYHAFISKNDFCIDHLEIKKYNRSLLNERVADFSSPDQKVKGGTFPFKIPKNPMKIIQG